MEELRLELRNLRLELLERLEHQSQLLERDERRKTVLDVERISGQRTSAQVLRQDSPVLSGDSEESSQESFVRISTAGHKLRAEMATERLQLSKRLKMASLEIGRIGNSLVQNVSMRVVNYAAFNNFIALVILLNVILLGIEVDITATTPLDEVPSGFWVANAVIVGIFVVELLLKMSAFGCHSFWFGAERLWNVFDFVLISISIVDVGLELVSRGNGNLRLFRSVRLARALRTLRVVRIFRYVTGLRTLVLSILSTMGSLFWTLMLLLILFYSFSLVLTQTVSDHCRELSADGDLETVVPQCPRELQYWHSMPQSMLTLFSAITNGLNWNDALLPLQEFSPVAVAFVIVYVTIATFAILNVVTGIFCNTAIESAINDREVATLKQVHMKDQQVQALQHIFRQIDREHVNEVSFEDVQNAVSKGELSSFLNAMGISTDDVWSLCMLIDADKNGSIDLDEFVTGCMQLHGPAKSLQIAKMSFENKLTRQAIKTLHEEVLQLHLRLQAPDDVVEQQQESF